MTQHVCDMLRHLLSSRVDLIEGWRVVQISIDERRDYFFQTLLDHMKIAQQPILIEGFSRHNDLNKPQVFMDRLAPTSNRNRVGSAEFTLDGKLIHEW